MQPWIYNPSGFNNSLVMSTLRVGISSYFFRRKEIGDPGGGGGGGGRLPYKMTGVFVVPLRIQFVD